MSVNDSLVVLKTVELMAAYLSSSVSKGAPSDVAEMMQAIHDKLKEISKETQTP